jgi:hypothetical protein
VQMSTRPHRSSRYAPARTTATPSTTDSTS